VIASEQSVCPSCGASFACARHAPEGCWCAQHAPISAERLRSLAGLGKRCLCPRCLSSLGGEQRDLPRAPARRR
jgi:hypothetical protein